MNPVQRATSLTALTLGVLASGVYATPTISVTAERAAAREAGPTPAVFLFQRTGDVSSPLNVNYTLGGSAAPGTDFLVWETRADFVAGSAEARVAILPRNDDASEGTETVTVSLAQGAGYSVGTPSSAAATIADDTIIGLRGVADSWDPDPMTGGQMLTGDIAYLDAWIENGRLEVGLRFADPIYWLSLLNVNLYVDSDHDPSTGDYRSGRLGGQEYRVNLEHLSKTWFVYRLRLAPPASLTENERNDLGGGTGPLTVDNDVGTIRASIPVSELGGTTNIDVFVVSNKLGTSDALGEGDRCPDYGSFSTSERRVVVRRPAVTQRTTIQDPPGEDSQGGAQDIRTLTLTTLADQFSLAMGMGDTFGIGSGSTNDGPRGSVSFDADCDLMTGWEALGAAIPTWGGDAVLTYWVGSQWVPLNTFEIQTDSSGGREDFGMDDSDGWWRVLPGTNSLVMGGSVSVLDGVRRGLVGGVRTAQRIPTSGRMALRAETWWNLTLVDAAPGAPALVDTASAATLSPYAWNPASVITATDPAEFGVAGDADIIQLDAQVLDGNLVLKGTLGVWMSTETGKVIEVAMDLDMNAATGTAYSNPPEGATIGADALVLVRCEDAQSVVVYKADITVPYLSTTQTTFHDAWVTVKTNVQQRLPGWFTLTIPLRALPVVGPKVRLYARTRYDNQAGIVDIAPPQPMEIWLTPPPTLKQAVRVMRIAGGLAEPGSGDSGLDVSAPPGFTLSDAVQLARRVAGL